MCMEQRNKFTNSYNSFNDISNSFDSNSNLEKTGITLINPNSFNSSNSSLTSTNSNSTKSNSIKTESLKASSTNRNSNISNSIPANSKSTNSYSPNNIVEAAQEFPATNIHIISSNSAQPKPPNQYIETQPNSLLNNHNLFNISFSVNGLHSFVLLNLDIGDSDSNTFLIDTGADISLLKVNCIKDDTLCYPDLKCYLSGIDNVRKETLGKCEAFINFDNGTVISQSFQIVKTDFPIPCDGIIGKDFLLTNKCVIDYYNQSFQIQNNQDRLQLPLNCKIIIPPRCEKLVKLPINKQDGEYLSKSNELLPGVYVGNNLIKIQDGIASIAILNSNDEVMEIGNLVLEIESLENFEIFQISEVNNNIQNRLQLLKEHMDFSHLNPEEENGILSLCREFNDIFHLKGDKLTFTSTFSHEIKLQPNTQPIYQKPYRLPEAVKEEISTQITQMLEDEIIEPSSSPWNFPLLAVPKKSTDSHKNWRIVVDFRKLNEVSIADVFPLPNIVEILDQLGKSQYFSTLDLSNGYHQVLMESQDRSKTAFSTRTGHYQFVRMPFGLKSAPATFQRLMNAVLTGLNGIKCFVYLDDIVIYGKNIIDHNEKLKSVFECLRNHNLKLNPSKCKFLRKEIIYLGHIISSNGILPDPTKLTAVQNFPTPLDTKTIKSFLGLAGYYRKFIPNFAKISSPLTNLLKQNSKFDWSAFCEEAFNALKSVLVNPPILQYPDFSKEFIISTDASDLAVGAVLSQLHDHDELPIAYSSRLLNKAEKNYPTVEKELLAIVWSVNQYRPYVYGRKFTIYTDHKPLIWLWKINNPTSRLMKWRIKLDEYQYEIIHKPGSKNSNADALSRHVPISKPNPETHTTMVITRSKSRQDNFPAVPSTSSTIVENPEIQMNTNTTLNTNIKVLDNDLEIQSVIKEFHHTPLGGHQGITRTYKRMKEYYYFPQMLRKIAKFIKSCESCQKNKHSLLTKIPMKITSTSMKPFEKLFLDVVGPLPSSYVANKFILTIQDDLTKYSFGIPLPNQETETIARAFVENVICIFGSPKSILTDQGTNFMSELFTNICKLLKIKKFNASAYHPQTNGALERSHKGIGEYLRNFSAQDPLDWDSWVQYAMFAYNTTPHSSTGYMPFQLLFGYKPDIPHSLLNNVEPVYYQDYLSDLKFKLQNSFVNARQNAISTKISSKNYYDRNSKPVLFEIGDLGLL